jgi:glycosyltransferase involved in cell wall biosynthesis
MVRERLLNGTSVYRLVGGEIKLSQPVEQSPLLQRLFVIALQEFRPDLVHVNHLLGFSPQIISLAKQFAAKVVVSLHDFYFACPRVHLQRRDGSLCTGPDGGKECARSCFLGDTARERARWGTRTLYFQRALRIADAVICYSDYVADYFRPLLGSAGKLYISPNGVPDEFVPSRPAVSPRSESNPLTIAYCGTVAPHKGPEVILQALRLAMLPTARLLIFGHIPDSAYGARLRQCAQQIPGLQLSMYGPYERAALPLLLADVDCLVAPSIVPEAGPIAPREALALGVPVIAARRGALPELIRKNDNGATFDPDQPQELSRILSRLANDAQFRNSLRSGATKSSIVTLSAHAEQVRSIYQSVLKSSSVATTNSECSELQTLDQVLWTLCGHPAGNPERADGM